MMVLGQSGQANQLQKLNIYKQKILAYSRKICPVLLCIFLYKDISYIILIIKDRNILVGNF